MENKKTIFDLFKETMSGTNGEGSSKRATMLFAVLFLLTPIVIVYLITYYLAATGACAAETCKMIIQEFDKVLWAILAFVLMLSGYATIEGVIALVKAVRGIREPDKPKDS